MWRQKRLTEMSPSGQQFHFKVVPGSFRQIRDPTYEDSKS